jgi:hypothetical protein
MAWSYTPGEDSDLNRVRELIGDTDTADQLLPNEAIAKYLLGGALAQTSIYLSAAMAAGEIANKFARGVQSINAGGSSVVFDIAQGRAKFFRDLAAQLRQQAARSGGATPYVGGISRAGKAAVESDSDRVTPAFTRRLGDTVPRDDDERAYWR